MRVREIQTPITELPSGELEDLIEWFEEYQAEAWDRQIVRDAEAGRFKALRLRVRERREDWTGLRL